MGPNDGWCDAPADRSYNRPVTLPYPASAERLWRSDNVYDLIVVVGYNDAPVVPGAGSAIFLHVARPNYSPTAGCIAFRLQDLARILSMMGPASRLDTRG
jgi:L,D-peptidoglycan transpeptidase YkuD (ErfK/YbiS/YcfS/YnhG family)